VKTGTRWTRRRFLRTAGIGGAALALAGARPARGLLSDDLRVYKGASYLSPAYKGLRYGVLGFVEQLQRNARDVLRVELFDAATLMKADEQLSGLREGAIQFMFHTTTYMTEEFPILGIIELPGVSEHLHEHGKRLAMGSALWKLINAELAKNNLFMLTTGGGTMEPEYIWSGRKRIASLADLEGARCRVVSNAAKELVTSFAATAVRIPSEEIHLALLRGTLDAILAAIDTVVARNLHESLRCCFLLPVTAAASAVFFLRDVWEKMPDREKAAFWKAGRWYDENQSTTGYKKIPQDEAWPVVRKAGIELVRPSKADAEAFARGSQSTWASWRRKVGEELGRQAIDLALGKA
jgi:TRAP-type C4-dicarboxylate transport system substrate-binding protein